MTAIRLDRNGSTATEFLAELFKFESCPDCGGDAADHEPLPLLGGWFAKCKTRKGAPT